MAPKQPPPSPINAPAKQPLIPGQGGAFDTHKDRSQWFFQRAAFPLRDAPPLALERFWEHPEDHPRITNAHWEEAGPANYAGRVTSLVVDPNDWNTLFAGAAAGGVWKTTNAGQLWTSCWPKLLNHNIGALTIHPVLSQELYCATGEGNLSADSYPGSGIFFTADGGTSWRPVFADPSGKPLAEESKAQLPRRVGTIAWGRADNGGDFRIAFGSVSHDEKLPAALYLDEGGMGLLPNVHWGNRSYNCYGVVFHPATAGLLYASIETRGTQNGIWRTDDFGQNWRQLKNGMPPGDICRRISLTISPSSPNVLYAFVCSRKTSVLGVFRTDDGGESWREIGGSHFAHEQQISYNNVIAVHPDNPDYAACGATELHLTRDGGKTWTQVTTGQRGNAGDPFPRNFVHNDHHAIVITGNGAIYSGNDGGVAVSFDDGTTWEDRSQGMVTTMFYAADVAQSNPTVFGGGTQDQGTLIAGVPQTAGGQVPERRNFTRVLPGDGGWIQFDPADHEHVFGSTSDLLLARHRRGKAWADGKHLAGWTPVPIPDGLISEGEKKQRSVAVMKFEPGARPGIKKVWVGTQRLWQTDDDGKKWNPISESFDDSSISAIECASTNAKLLFVGTSAGGIFRSLDGGTTWSGDLSCSVIPRRMITRIAAHPAEANTVIVAVASSGAPGTSLSRITSAGATPTQQPYGHIFKSEDRGDTWRPLDDNLPDVVYNGIAFQTEPPHMLFVGGDCGVWVAADLDPKHVPEGGRWFSLAGNMPNVVVSDLIYHKKDHSLTAATYGRGIWRLKIPEQFAFLQGDAEPDENTPRAAGFSRDDSVAAPSLLMPAAGAQLPLPQDANHISMELKWAAVPGAVAYTIDVVQPEYTATFTSKSEELVFDFVPVGQGPPWAVTWQVWAILPESRRSPGSEKRAFTFTR